jgi:hypothetical protein
VASILLTSQQKKVLLTFLAHGVEVESSKFIKEHAQTADRLRDACENALTTHSRCSSVSGTGLPRAFEARCQATPSGIRPYGPHPFGAALRVLKATKDLKWLATTTDE